MSEYHPGKVIKKYRELKGWSQQKLADHWPKTDGETGATWHYVQKVEYGKRNIVDQGVLRKLSDLLDIPLWEFGFSEHDPYSGANDPSNVDNQQELSDQASVAKSSIQADIGQNTSQLDTANLIGKEVAEEHSFLGTKEETQSNPTVTPFPVNASSSSGIGHLAGLWADDLLAIYTQGIAACQDLYFSGCPHQVQVILPLYCNQQEPSLVALEEVLRS